MSETERAFEDRIVYEAPEPHDCLNGGESAMTQGSIVQCECGRYFVFGTHYWDPVSWWNFRAKLRIAQHRRRTK